MNLHELLGQKEEQLAVERANFAKMMGLLVQLKDGRLTLDQVEVSETGIKINAPAVSNSDNK